MKKTRDTAVHRPLEVGQERHSGELDRISELLQSTMPNSCCDSRRSLQCTPLVGLLQRIIRWTVSEPRRALHSSFA